MGAVFQDQVKYKLDPKKLRGAYFYTGASNNGLSLMATGLEQPNHKWSKAGVDRDGDTFCVSGRKRVKGATFDNQAMNRVTVNGEMNSKKIIEACAKIKMKPICNHAKFADGRCILVSGNWHISDPKEIKKRKDSMGRALNPKLIKGTYTYCSTDFEGASMLNLGSSQRISTTSDRGGDTLCGNPPRHDPFEFGNYYFNRVPVKGSMTSKNIAATCKQLGGGNRPLCDTATVADGTCRIV